MQRLQILRQTSPRPRTPGGLEFIFVAIDKFTKWIEYKPLVKFNSAKAIEFLQEIMHWFGMPNPIITDLGSPFTSAKFKAWSQDCGISIDYALVAHPWGNGQMERANGLLLQGLKPRLYKSLKKYGEKRMQELSKVVWGI